MQNLGLFASLVLAAWQPHLLDAKLQVGSLTIGGPEARSWQFVSKFGFGLGVGEYDVRFRLRRPARLPAEAQLEFGAYLDEDWDLVERLRPCEQSLRSLSRRTFSVDPAMPGAWSAWYYGAVEHRVRSHIWYFGLSDCRHGAVANASYPDVVPEAIELDFEFRARQEGGSEFSVEVQHMLALHCLMLLLSGIVILAYGHRCWRLYRQSGPLHPVVWALTAAMALQYMAQALHLAHLAKYSRGGVGLRALDALSGQLSMASQAVHTTLLVLIARGYTLPGAAAGHGADLARPLGALVLLAHSALVGLDRLRDGAPHRHHEHEGAAGWAILALRLLLLGWFLRAIRASRQQAGLQLSTFLDQFRLVGAVHFLAYPVLLVAVKALAPYLRQPAMQLGVLATHVASDAWLAGLFLSRGSYFKVSTLSASLLPGALPGKRD